MREYERVGLLERIEREGSTIGATIPEEIDIEGERVPLQATVVELTGTDDLTADNRERLGSLVRGLRGHRRSLKRQIEAGACTREEGEAIVDRIAGIDRAITALEAAGGPSVADQAKARERMDQRRWMSFLREALGHDKTGRRR